MVQRENNSDGPYSTLSASASTPPGHLPTSCAHTDNLWVWEMCSEILLPQCLQLSHAKENCH